MKFFRIVCIFWILVLCLGPILPDTVRLKDGRSFKNVKSKIEGKTIQIEKIDGSIQSFPIESLKTIEPGEVKKPISKIDPAIPSEENPKQQESISQKPKEDPIPSISVQKNYYWLPFPFWSYLNSEPKPDLGIAITFGKGISFLLAAAYMQNTVSATTDREKLGQLILLRQFNQTGENAFLTFAIYRHQRFKEQVLTPLSGETITKDEYTGRSEFTLGLFLFAVFLDGYFTFRCCSPQEGKSSSVSEAKLRFTPNLEYIGGTPQESLKAEMLFFF